MDTETAEILAKYIAHYREWRRLDALPITPEREERLDSLAAEGWIMRSYLIDTGAWAAVLQNDRGALAD